MEGAPLRVEMFNLKRLAVDDNHCEPQRVVLRRCGYFVRKRRRLLVGSHRGRKGVGGRGR
eukprot:6672179-Heterocapsa_arctica.AAC.1